MLDTEKSFLAMSRDRQLWQIQQAALGQSVGGMTDEEKIFLSMKRSRQLWQLFNSVEVLGASSPTPQQYGAIADGSSHPLSGVYGNLSAAQAVYSFAIPGCSYSNASQTVSCPDASFLAVGYPVSGFNIPANTTVSSLNWIVPSCTTTNNSAQVSVLGGTAGMAIGSLVSGAGIPINAIIQSIDDGTHFTMVNPADNSPALATASATVPLTFYDALHFTISALPTGTQNSVTLTSSYITSLTQELDYAGVQALVIAKNGGFVPAGSYQLGTSTVKVKAATDLGGVTLQGSGKLDTRFYTSDNNTAFQVMSRYVVLRGFSICYLNDNSVGSQGDGIVLDTGRPETNPPRYALNCVIEHVFIRGYRFSFNNPFKWDECAISYSIFYWFGTAVKTTGNLDTLKIYACNASALTPTMLVTMTAVLVAGSNIVTVNSTANLLAGMVVNGTGISSEEAYVVSVTDGTHFVLSRNADISEASTTLMAQSVALWVDSDGRACWSGGVVGAGYSLYSSGGAGAYMRAEDMHYEGTGGAYAYNGSNSHLDISHCFFADSGITYHVVAQRGSVTCITNVDSSSPFAINQVDRASVTANNAYSPIKVVTWETTYCAMPWHTAASDESPGYPFWDAPSEVSEGRIIAQVTIAGIYQNRLWRCVRTGAASWAYLPMAGDGFLYMVEQPLPVTPVNGMVVKDSADHHFKGYDATTASWKQLD